MRTSVLAIFILLASIVCAKAQEVTLFDRDGKPVAYIDFDKDAIIYLWGGTPVAFLDRNMTIVGFNGRFLGWYEDGIVYDKSGNIVGGREGAVGIITQFEPIKGIQGITPIRPITPITPIRPIFSFSWSSTSLAEFLRSGN